MWLLDIDLGTLGMSEYIEQEPNLWSYDDQFRRRLYQK